MVKFIEEKRLKCFDHQMRKNPMPLAAREYNMKLEASRSRGRSRK
jgi:hypothetical protein